MSDPPASPVPRLRLRSEQAAHPADKPPRPVPLFYHPIIALSVVLVIASLVQIVVAAFKAYFLETPELALSPALAHGLLYNALSAWVREAAFVEHPHTALYVVCLSIALLSATGWYAIAWFTLGPVWAFWTGVCWVIHPAFAVLAQRTGPHSLLMFAVAAGVALLSAWRKWPTWWLLLLLGAACGVLTLVSLIGLVLLALCTAAVAFKAMRRPHVRRQAVLLWVGFGLGSAPWWFWTTASWRAQLVESMQTDLWASVAAPDGSSVAKAAKMWKDAHSTPPHRPVAFLRSQVLTNPDGFSVWFGGRWWQTFHATVDGKLERPLFVLQLTWFVPAFWGFLIALREDRLRGFALLGVTLIVTQWGLAALVEPLTRNLTPVGGFGVIFGLIGFVDVWNRISHREPRRKARRPAAI